MTPMNRPTTPRPRPPLITALEAGLVATAIATASPLLTGCGSGHGAEPVYVTGSTEAPAPSPGARRANQAETELRAPDPGRYQHFAEALDLDGDLAAIARPAWDDHYLPFAWDGAVDLVRRQIDPAGNVRWVREARFAGPNSWTGFGATVAVSGDTLAIGEPRGDGVGGTNAGGRGRVWLYERDGASWRVARTFHSTDLRGFGQSVDLDADVLAIGAPWDDVGAVEVHRRDESGAWRFEARLESSPGERSELGWSVRVDGDRIAAVDRENERVHVYRFNGARTWIEETRLALDGAPEANGSVGLSGDLLAVGDRASDDGRGEVRVYRHRHDGWRLWAVLPNPSREPQPGHGRTVALSGRTLVAGRRGAATIYVHRPWEDDWVAVLNLAPHTTDPAASIGEALAASGAGVLAGAPHDGDYAGIAYHHDLGVHGFLPPSD